MTTTNTVKLEVAGKAAATTQEIMFGFSLTVKEQTKRGVKLEISYDRMKLSVQSGLFHYIYDTATHEGNSELGILDSITGKRFYITFTEKGELLEVSGMNILLNSIIKKEDLTQSLLSLLLSLFDEDRVKENFRGMFHYFPEQPVRVGDKWSLTDKRNQDGFALTVKSEWQLKQADRDLLTLKLTARTAGSDARVEMNGLQGFGFTAEGCYFPDAQRLCAW